MTTDRGRILANSDLPEEEEEEDSLCDRYLTFCLKGDDYGIAISHVTEIIGMQRITSVPDMPAFVRGVINLRGYVVPVVDVRLRFHMPEREYDDRTCIVIVRIQGSQVGLVVDTVQEVLHIQEDHVTPPPRLSRGLCGRCIHGMARAGDRVKILLDVEKLLLDDEIQELSDVAAQSDPAGTGRGTA